MWVPLAGECRREAFVTVVGPINFARRKYQLASTACRDRAGQRQLPTPLLARLRAGVLREMSAVMRGRVLGALGVLAVVHALTHLELLPVPFWVITLSVSMLLIYSGSLYSLMLSRFASETVSGATLDRAAGALQDFAVQTIHVASCPPRISAARRTRARLPCRSRTPS